MSTVTRSGPTPRIAMLGIVTLVAPRPSMPLLELRADLLMAGSGAERRRRRLFGQPEEPPWAAFWVLFGANRRL